MMVLLDTSALLRWSMKPSQLSEAAAQAISSADRLVVSAISIWELAWKEKQGRLSLPGGVVSFLANLREISGMEIKPVDVETWWANVNLDWEHRDPADRTIVAAATLLDCPLISSDETIRRFYAKAIW